MTTVIALALASCGDGDEDADADTGQQPVPATTAPAATEAATTTPTPTPADSTAPGGAGDSGETVYEVQEGDTLWAIAEEFGTTVDAIAEANGIDDPSTIFPGDELVIPQG